MTKRLLLVFFSILLLFEFNSCSVDGNLPVIRIPENLSQDALLLKNHFSSIRYVPLETTDESLISSIFEIQEINNYLLVTTKENLFLFLSDNGRFIRKIGHKGVDPEGYRTPYFSFYDAYSQSIFCQGWNSTLVKYSIEGKFMGKHTIPNPSNSSFAYPLEMLDSTSICAFFSNLNGIETKRIIIFSESGEILKMYPNHRIMEKYPEVFSSHDGTFYRYDNKLFFKEQFVDTVYCVMQDTLMSKYVIDLSKYNIPYEKRYTDINNASSLFPLLENENCILFVYVPPTQAAICIHDKKKNQSFFYPYSFKNGIQDDINNFLPIKKIYSVGESGCFLSVLEAFDVYDKLHEADYKNPSEKVKALMNISSDDNPVVVFIK
jgi:hypothetical protein